MQDRTAELAKFAITSQPLGCHISAEEPPLSTEAAQTSAHSKKPKSWLKRRRSKKLKKSGKVEKDEVNEEQLMCMAIEKLQEEVGEGNEILSRMDNNIVALQNAPSSKFVALWRTNETEDHDRIIKSTEDDVRKFHEKFLHLAKIVQAMPPDWDAVKRAQHQQLTALSNKFQSTLVEYQKTQEVHEEHIRRSLRHQLQVRDPDLKIEPGTELQLLDEQVFSIQMSQETIDLLQRRENEMKEVAQSVHDLNDLMTSYSFLVAQQGECLDSIEQRLEEAKAHVRVAKADLKTARKMKAKQRSRFAMMVALIVGSIVSVGAFFGVKVAAGAM